MKIQQMINRIISSLLIISLLAVSLSACGKKGETIPEYNVDENTTIDTETIAEIITNEINNEVSEAEIQSEDAKPVEISTDWNDYVGDLDTFVYGLLSAEYGLCYDVFDACIDLKDGTTVYGLAYSDYSGVFESDEGKTFFPAGFISLIGEPEIPTDEIDGGLVITNLQTDDDYQFIYSYDVDPYMEHCIIWDQYLKYGIDEKGQITYEATKYIKGECDESIGSLYSYDENKYVLE